MLVTLLFSKVQEYLDAIVDEFQTLENAGEFEDTGKPLPPNNESSKFTPLPKISVSRAFDNEIEQYLFGYGENYGKLSSPAVESPMAQQSYDDLNSVEVNTSLDTSQTKEDTDSDDLQLPREVESIHDQIQRFQASIEQNKEPAQKVSQQKT